MLVIPAWPFYAILVSGIRHRTPVLRAGAVLQTLLFVAACWIAAGRGVWNREIVSPLAIGAGLAAGHLIFGMSVLATHGSLRQAAGHLIELGPLWNFIADNPPVLMQFASVSIAEEAIYRAALQPLAVSWLGPVLGVGGVAVVFACVHEHFFRNTAGQSGEFLAFSVLLGALYYWTGSLILVMVVHAVRNVEIAFMERLAQIEESGDPEAGEREALFAEGRLAQALVVAPACGMAVACVDVAVEPACDPAGHPVQARCMGSLENV
jgi:membrane protease YdiL (CAAX protease family)